MAWHFFARFPDCHCHLASDVVVAQRRSEGRVFVLKDPASADLETQFLAGLVGGVMVT